MDEKIKPLLDGAKKSMDKTIEHTSATMAKIRAGKALPSMLDDLRVDYYGSPTAVSQVASISSGDARTLLIKPWEKNMLGAIERAIINSDLGLNPQNDGEVVRIVVPPLTEERRRDLVKQAKNEAEAGKVGIRNIRKDINESLKKLQKDGASEDAVKRAETDVQKLTDSYIVKVDELFAAKEKDIMKV
jgi:ribosome recycling factor